STAVSAIDSESALVKVAVTDRATSIVTGQAPVPVHAPLQPENVEPAAGAAARLTTVPGSELALPLAPQLIPAGDEVTVPLPDSVTVSWGFELPRKADFTASIGRFRPSVETYP